MTRIEKPYFSKYLNKPIFIRYTLNGNGERVLVGILLSTDDGHGKLLISSRGRVSHVDPAAVTEDYTPVGRVEP